MDEYHYKAARTEMVSVPCVFEKAILANRVACSKAEKKNLAQREVVCCAEKACQARCHSWLQLMREKSRFALQLGGEDDMSVPLPHSKEMRVQVGGIEGLQQLLEHGTSKATGGVQDVFAVLEAGLTQYGSLAQLPFTELVKYVAQCRARRR